ncbi:hypothetical protein DMENIID0001_046530 [Sergentomyia squamirostris]
MKFLVIISLVAFVALLGQCEAKAAVGSETIEGDTRVYGGYIPQPKRDYMTVLIRYYINGELDYACSGIIIGNFSILSTYYCLTYMDLIVDTFKVTITGRTGRKFFTTITGVAFHPDYNETTMANNLAIGYVADQWDFTTDDIWPVTLPEASWGCGYFTGKGLPLCGYRDPYTTNNTYDWEPTCGTFIPKPGYFCAKAGLSLNENELCAQSGAPTKVAVCEVDFGAGLSYYDSSIDTYFLYALASYTVDNTCAEGPTAYIIIAFYLDWINANLL